MGGDPLILELLLRDLDVFNFLVSVLESVELTKKVIINQFSIL